MNRVSTEPSADHYDERNRLVAGPDGTRTYTARGPLAAVTSATKTVTYTFDALDRTTAIDNGTTTVAYTHDALDRVASRNGTPFTYAGTELDPVSDGQWTYARSPAGRVLALSDGTTSQLAGLNRHGDLAWLHTGNTPSATTVYGPFGQPTGQIGTIEPTIGYQADWTDPATDDVWMGARWYQPSTATFTSRDTYQGELTTPVSLNRYTYAHNNPLAYFDPDGHRVLAAGNLQDETVEDRAISQEHSRLRRRGEHVTTAKLNRAAATATQQAASTRQVVAERGGVATFGASLGHRPIPSGWDQWPTDQRHAYIANLLDFENSACGFWCRTASVGVDFVNSRNNQRAAAWDYGAGTLNGIADLATLTPYGFGLPGLRLPTFDKPVVDMAGAELGRTITHRTFDVAGVISTVGGVAGAIRSTAATGNAVLAGARGSLVGESAATLVDDAARASRPLAPRTPGVRPGGGSPLHSPDFVVHPNGEIVRVPKGAVGPMPARTGSGFQFRGGSGGHGLDPRVTDVRIMDPVLGGKHRLPNGYVSYSNASGQTVNPWTGRTIDPSNPWWHWEWSP